MNGEPCFQCGIKTWTIHHCPGLGPWWKNNGWVRKSELASYEFAKEREQKRQNEARPVTYRALPGPDPMCIIKLDELSDDERARLRSPPSMNQLIRWSSFGW